MYNDYLSSNDDDLFEKKSDPKPDSSNQNVNSFIKEIEDLFKSDNKEAFFSDINFKSKFFNSLTDSTNSYIYNIDSYQRSLFDSLNRMTNGLFAKQVYADILEESISRRLVVFEFVNLLASSQNDKIIQFLSEKMDINLDSRFYNIYLNSMLDIMNFVIDYSISIYTSLCPLIDRTPVQSIVNRSPNDIDSAIFSSDTYINKHLAVIRSEIGF